jgi:hypothetical protein
MNEAGETLPMAIIDSRLPIGEVQFDLLERIATARPAHQRLGNRGPARQEPYTPLPCPGLPSLVDSSGHGFDQCLRVAG